jgi:signal transduction histidine kinase
VSAPYNGRMREGRWLNAAALATWLICGLPQLVAIAQGAFRGWPATIWTASYLVYGAALISLLGLVRPLRGRYTPLLLVGVEIATALTVVILSLIYRHGTNSTPALLVIVAAMLPYLAPSKTTAARPRAEVALPPGVIWSIIAVLMLANVAILYAVDRRWTAALSFGISMGGFMLFAAASSFLVRSEAAAREQLAALNAELMGTRALLAESSRAEERLRISRDLHDTLGHHLTALSLQLDVASRVSEGQSVNHIRQAHAITKLLLSDVRDVVSRLREPSQLDLAQAIRALAIEHRGPAEAGGSGHGGVAIHLDLPEELSIEDAARAEILLRCVQEIITNTARHAQARNLWIRLESRTDGIALHARDDGRGADLVACGNGLTGMRERFQQFSGHVEFSGHAGDGFEVRAFLPSPVIA